LLLVVEIVHLFGTHSYRHHMVVLMNGLEIVLYTAAALIDESCVFSYLELISQRYVVAVYNAVVMHQVFCLLGRH
jgi:hypothetical protein